jgi:tetratricopeptide (TPR) repeat protein
MPRSRSTLALALAFLAGAAAGAFASKKVTLGPGDFQGKAPAEAGANLLAAAESLAGSGSWENLAVARVYYLAGQKERGQAIIDRVEAGKTKAGDFIRIGRIYSQAGEWEKAKAYYDRVVEMAPKDADWLAEIGHGYLLAGDRAAAEELFARSFAEKPSSQYNALRAASAYLGVETLP